MRFKVETKDGIEQVKRHLDEMDLSKPMQVVIEPYKLTRSIAQNRLMHKWFNEIAEGWLMSTGEAISAEAWKEYLKQKFLGFDMVDMPYGSVMPITKHTSDCSVEELSVFLLKVESYCTTEFEIQLSYPDDLYYLSIGR